MFISICTPALSIALLAAGACSAPATSQAPRTDTLIQSEATGAVDFRSANWLTDRTIVNSQGEKIAVVSDLILDRGTGRVAYLVARTGTTFGLGGRAIALPYDSLRWESAGNDRFITDMTANDMGRLPEYTPANWQSLNQPAKDDGNLLRQRLATDAATPADPYGGAMDKNQGARIEGEITAVERVRTTTFGEQVLISVRDAKGTVHKVALGPSWFVNGMPAAPLRGDHVVVTGFAMPRDPDRLTVASQLQIGDRSLKLRGTDGFPVWAMRTVEVDGQTYTAPYSRYLLLSTLPGMKVDCRGNDCGKVADVVLDRVSGEVGFLSIDPNQNFLGIGDTKRMIPWSVARVTLDGTVRIDASKDMVLSTIETPSDLSTLDRGGEAAKIYKAFDVRQPQFVRSVAAATVKPDGSNAWSLRGPVVDCIESDSAMVITGTVTEWTEVKFASGVKPARALRVRVGDRQDADELVLLGPSGYMDNQKPMCAKGDAVTIDACRTTVDGQRYWIARNVTCNGNRVVLLDRNHAPVWAQ
jgi:sporulation protein YlmC with PRC-barrel domain